MLEIDAVLAKRVLRRGPSEEKSPRDIEVHDRGVRPLRPDLHRLHRHLDIWFWWNDGEAHEVRPGGARRDFRLARGGRAADHHRAKRHTYQHTNGAHLRMNMACGDQTGTARQTDGDPMSRPLPCQPGQT